MAFPHTQYSPLRLINPVTMVAYVAHWVGQRLTKQIRLIRASSSLGAFCLPTEIILMIISHLDGPSKVSLSLTCQSLHNLCFSGSPPLDLAGKRSLLLLLERDVASLYFCHRCIKLHHWHTRWSRSMTPWYKETMTCKRGGDGDRLYFPHINYIPYFHARLIMNRHFYGPTHGPPVKKIEGRALSFHHLHGFVEKASQHARIVDDHLLVSSAITMYHSRGDSSLLRNRIEDMGDDICAHLTMARCWHLSATTQLPELVKDAAAPHEFRPCEQVIGSCILCLTDYRIDISWRGAKKGYVIKIFVYRQLGDCRSPFDWSWRARLDSQTERIPRTAYSPNYGPGYVRDQWNKADGIPSSRQGRWVEIPGMVGGEARNV
jgi:hypothetical protein